MLLKDLNGENGHWSWNDRYAFEEWLEKHSGWGEAEIISDAIVDDFPTHYEYDVQYLIRYNGKHYNFIISKDTGRYGYGYPGRPKKLGVIIKRYYMKDEPRRKRQQRVHLLEREMTWNSVNRGGDHTYRNDCQIWSFAKLNDISYTRAYELLSAQGWAENSTNLTEPRWEKALAGLQRKMTGIYAMWRVKRGTTLKNVWKLIPREGRYLIFVERHVLCAIDGVLFDNISTAPYTRIRRIFKIENL